MKLRRTYLVLALLFCAVMPGCDTDRLAQFGTFAAAGSAYVTAFHSFTQQAGVAFIGADSATLITARQMAGASGVSANAAAFRQKVSTADTQMKTYLDNLQKLDRHADLLGSYFSAITALTDGKGSSSTVTAVKGLVDSINQFNPEIEKLSFGGKNVKDFLAPVTELVVAHFAVKALDEELKKSAPAIQRALALQQAAVSALGEQLKASLGASLEVQESKDVIGPYVANAPLPDAWPAARLAYLQASLDLQTADSAKAAIGKLQSAFTDLTTNTHAQIDFRSLIDAIGKMAGYASAAKSATQS
ncbi:MAG TPA: hypothetical protein VHN81_11325 [Edaphobacter sp.]|nr:hypothetical protein [Edaphobacter sp.]